MSKKRILYVKNSSSKFDLNTYNVQAVGLGKAICRKGYDYDFLFFSNRDEIIQEQIIDNSTFRIITKKGVRILRSYYCMSALSDSFLQQYDYIISTEYGQIMTVMLSKKHENVSLYSGPYYNLFKFPFISPIYDVLFTEKINRNIKHKFVKSILAKEYLEKKGYTDLRVIGVGLDTERFEKEKDIKPETKEIVDYMKNNDCILYVGALSDRKNFSFIIKVFKELLTKKKEIKLVCIGKGNKEYVSKVLSTASQNVMQGIKRVDCIDNAQLKFIYPHANAFLLPSKQEIFGMVLLEAMYLGAPVVSSVNGGSLTLIENDCTGQIIPQFDVTEWSQAILKYIDNDKYRNKIVLQAKKLIATHFTWDSIADKFIDIIRNDK